jgi:hypothetical protein
MSHFLEHAHDTVIINSTVYRLEEIVPDRFIFSFQGKRFDNAQLAIPEVSAFRLRVFFIVYLLLFVCLLIVVVSYSLCCFSLL